MLQAWIASWLRNEMGGNVLLLVLLSLALVVYKMVIYPFYVSPLKDVPGPYWHRVSYLPSIVAQLRRNWVRRVHDLHCAYGDVVLLSPSEVGFNGKRRYIDDIYVRNMPKLAYYQNFKLNDHDNLFSSVDNACHLQRKKALVGIYLKSSLTSNPRVKMLLKSKIKQLISEIDHDIGSSNSSESYLLFGALAMDVISAFELGRDSGTSLLLSERRAQVLDALKELSNKIMLFSLLPHLLKWIKKFLMQDSWLVSLFDRVILDNIPNDTTYKKLLSKGFSGDSIHSFVGDNIIAGHETTAFLLTYLTYELSRPVNKHRQDRLQREIFENFGKCPSEIIEDDRRIDELVYLDAVLKENFRVHTLGPGSLPRMNDKPYEATLLNGTRVILPTGTTLSMQQHLLHRDPSVFPQPDLWLPERWLQNCGESDELFERRQKRMNHNIMLFGKGVRMCIGKNFALAEIKMAIVNLYSRFESTVCTNWSSPVKYDESEKYGRPIALVSSKLSANDDESKMAMIDNITTRPSCEECWLKWSILH